MWWYTPATLAPREETEMGGSWWFTGHQDVVVTVNSAKKQALGSRRNPASESRPFP